LIPETRIGSLADDLIVQKEVGLVATLVTPLTKNNGVNSNNATRSSDGISEGDVDLLLSVGSARGPEVVAGADIGGCTTAIKILQWKYNGRRR
jgi:hypothetical protein